MIFSATVTLGDVTAEVDIVVDEHAVATYLGQRAIGNKSGRATLSKLVGYGRTSLLIADVRRSTKRSSGDAP